MTRRPLILCCGLIALANFFAYPAPAGDRTFTLLRNVRTKSNQLLAIKWLPLISANACLGAPPSRPAQAYILSFINSLSATDQRIFFCAALPTFRREWELTIPPDAVPPVLAGPGGPDRYVYAAPLARCVPRASVDWCVQQQAMPADGFARLWMMLHANCTRQSCPFANDRDWQQAMYYLLSMLDQRLQTRARP